MSIDFGGIRIFMSHKTARHFRTKLPHPMGTEGVSEAVRG